MYYALLMENPGRWQSQVQEMQLLHFFLLLGGHDVNLVQRSYYYGHYGFAGAKVQHVLQADDMCYSFTCPLCCHDAMVLCELSMLTMLSILFANNNPLRPVNLI